MIFLANACCAPNGGKKKHPQPFLVSCSKALKKYQKGKKQDRIKNLSKYLLLAEGYKQNVTGHQQDILINLVMDVIVAVIARKEPVPLVRPISQERKLAPKKLFRPKSYHRTPLSQGVLFYLYFIVILV